MPVWLAVPTWETSLLSLRSKGLCFCFLRGQVRIWYICPALRENWGGQSYHGLEGENGLQEIGKEKVREQGYLKTTVLIFVSFNRTWLHVLHQLMLVLIWRTQQSWATAFPRLTVFLSQHGNPGNPGSNGRKTARYRITGVWHGLQLLLFKGKVQRGGEEIGISSNSGRLPRAHLLTLDPFLSPPNLG